MNLLAHLHLSPNHSLVRVFNFSGDGFKGTAWREGADSAQLLGIDLHRFIDHFTDSHPLTTALKKRLRPLAGRYSGVALDLCGDFFLHRHWHHMSALQPHTANTPISPFVDTCLRELQAHRHLLKGRAAHMAPHLIAENWLMSYAQYEGLVGAARGIAHRHSGGKDLYDFFLHHWEEQQEEMERWFLALYPELLEASQTFVSNHEESHVLG